MRGSIPVKLPFIIGAVLLLASCASLTRVQPYELTARVMKLTLAVQEVLVMPEGGRPETDAQILEAAFTERPELVGPFQGLPILIRHSGSDVVLLVCSPDGKHAWIEDASWTSGIDYEWYEIDPEHPAVFTLDPARASRGPGG
jgi:hypothetical protein